jgi:trehalose 6-phosphate phosphatase
MIYLFSARGRATLSAYVDAATLFTFDLDGTLAPIIPDPAAIVIPDAVRQSLMQLNDMAPLAIITGRSRTDALAHLGFTPRYLVGNHGAEGLPGKENSGEDFIRLCQGWKKQLQLLLPARDAAGIFLEEKGETMALHYRQAPDALKAQELILGAMARLTPAPRRVAGKFVENLVPQAAVDKGVALETLMGHLGCPRAIFVGDDVTDEDVFRRKNPAILGIRVGENPESVAGFYLHGQEEMAELLQEIIAHLPKAERIAL